jgi:hypothetical protein
MTLETSSLFAKVIQDHLELKQRNATLESELPIDRYKTDDPFDNHPLFKSEEQARIEETMSGLEVFPGEDALELAREDTVEHFVPEVEESLWSRSRDFDWGD